MKFKKGDLVTSICFGKAEVIDIAGDEVLLKHSVGRTHGGEILYAEHIDKASNCKPPSDVGWRTRLW